jgi:hypothetical protein
MLEAIKTYVMERWEVIPKIPLFMSVAIVCIPIWFALKWAYQSRLENKDTLIELQKAQLEDYKSKLDGASPDQAKARVEALQTQLDNLVKAVGPRSLSDVQSLAITQSAVAIGGSPLIEIAQDMAAPDAQRFSRQLGQAFSNARWRVVYPGVMGISTPPPTGIAVYAANPASPTVPEQAVMKGFRDAGIDFDIQLSPFDPGEVRQARVLVTSKIK